MVFSNTEDRVKRAGPSGLGDLEVTEYIARIHSGPFEREDCASVHLATTEERKSLSMFMLCFAIIINILFFHYMYIHCIHLARGMMHMCIPNSPIYYS